MATMQRQRLGRVMRTVARYSFQSSESIQSFRLNLVRIMSLIIETCSRSLLKIIASLCAYVWSIIDRSHNISLHPFFRSQSQSIPLVSLPFVLLLFQNGTCSRRFWEWSMAFVVVKTPASPVSVHAFAIETHIWRTIV